MVDRTYPLPFRNGPQEPGQRLPFWSFTPVVWHGTTLFDRSEEKLGLSFEMEDGSVIRLLLDVETAKHVMETLTQGLVIKLYLEGRQSRKSSETPSQSHVSVLTSV
jgi:hypothetical protein